MIKQHQNRIQYKNIFQHDLHSNSVDNRIENFMTFIIFGNQLSSVLEEKFDSECDISNDADRSIFDL